MRFIPVQVLACIFLCYSHAAESVATFNRYCAVCDILGAESFVSESGQFLVHAFPAPQFEDRSALTNPANLRLEPQNLAVTAERTKRIFLQEIHANDSFRGKTHLIILDRGRFDQPITLVSRLYRDGFEYQIGIPRLVPGVKLVKGLIQSVILEYANRNSHRSAELPAWLVEGMTQQVLTSITPVFVGNKKPITYEFRGYDRLARARTFFATNAGATMNELSFADLNTEPKNPLETSRFQHSAHIFVHELLALPQGPQLMSRFIQALPFSMNWQKAFFQVYSAHFQTPLDLEKWWALVWVDFKNKHERQEWPLQLGLQKLEATLLTSLEHRQQTNSLPQRRDASLQELLSETDFELQKAVLEQKLQQLFFISFNLSPQASSLSGAYQQAIRNYLEQRSRAEYQPGLRSDPETRNEYLVKNTVKELNSLDQNLADLRSGKIPPESRPARNTRQARR